VRQLVIKVLNNMKGISTSCTFCVLQAYCTTWGFRKSIFHPQHVIWNFKYSLRIIFCKWLFFIGSCIL